ncbi:SIMPL domain-containing protein [Lyngbya confervoides]|uniref:SIMPL domain-containing protein n=1 Tax=Lyngbya confervoides BDU141951 TaxID=1574623 RepID=A0ABD4T426_9CYAN|nr:SIMPL domain-containing protein [Lyngbya confervoides]MCM1983239.1 SIMPL domain-containing protein [Lyngbya confervoides BDU141951]
MATLIPHQHRQRPGSSLRWTFHPQALKLGGISILLAVLSWGTGPAAIAQTVMSRILSVTGEGQERIAATEADVNLAVEATAKTANEAQQQVARQADAVVSYLRSQNVQRLQTTGINLSPQYRYDDGRQTLIGYQASNSVTFRITADRAGTVLDRAVNAGATRIDSISFTAADSAISSAQKQALQRATQDARAQAQAVLSTLGFSEQEIIGIQINGAATPPPPPLPVARMAISEAADRPTTPVIAGEQTVRAAVTLQIRY